MINLNKIGENAGILWHILDSKGEMTVEKLTAQAGLTLDEVMTALGWLARENKVEFDEKGDATLVKLPRQFFFG